MAGVGGLLVGAHHVRSQDPVVVEVLALRPRRAVADVTVQNLIETRTYLRYTTIGDMQPNSHWTLLASTPVNF